MRKTYWGESLTGETGNQRKTLSGPTPYGLGGKLTQDKKNTEKKNQIGVHQLGPK